VVVRNGSLGPRRRVLEVACPEAERGVLGKGVVIAARLEVDLDLFEEAVAGLEMSVLVSH